MKKGLLFSAALVLGVAGLAQTATVSADTVSVPTDTAKVTIAEDGSTTTPAQGTSTAQIQFTGGALQLLAVPNLDFESHQVWTQTTFNKKADTALAADTAMPSDTDTAHSFVHIQDQTGNNAGWGLAVKAGKPTITGTDGTTKDLTTTSPWTITFKSGLTQYTSADGKNLSAAPTTGAADASLAAKINLDDTSNAQTIWNAQAAAGNGDWYLDFAPADSATLETPNIKDQAVGTIKSNLTWTLQSGPIK